MKFTEQSTLTPEQERIWIEWNLAPQSTAYNIPIAFKLTGNLDEERLRKSLTRAILEIKELRSQFDDHFGTTIRTIIPGDRIEKFNFLKKIKEKDENKIKELLKNFFNTNFDIKKFPLFRFILIHQDKETNYLLMLIHHIIIDGYSTVLLLNKISDIYNKKLYKNPINFISASTQNYFKATQEQKSLKEKSITYWEKNLKQLNLNINIQNISYDSFTKKSLTTRKYFEIKEPSFSKIIHFTQKHKVSVFIFLYSVFSILIYRYTQLERFAISYPVDIRGEKLSNVFGFFVNNLPFKVDIDKNISFFKLLKKNYTQRQLDKEHQNLSILEIIKHLRKDENFCLPNISFGPTSFPILGVNKDKEGLNLEKIKVSPLKIYPTESPFDLSFLYTITNKFTFAIDYKANLFDDNYINLIFEHFKILIDNVLKFPNASVSQISFLTKKENKLFFKKWNNTTISYNLNKSLKDCFEEQAANFPNKIAIIHNDEYINYHELNNKANLLASFILRSKFTKESIIAICINKSINMLICMLAVIKAGHAYLPIDPSYPKARIEHMLEDSGAVLLLVDNESSINNKEKKFMPVNIKHVLLENKSPSNPSTTSSSELAYIIYTSGSTGFPKGVAITKKSLLNLINWHHNYYKITQKDNSCIISGEGFDAMVWEIWPYLTKGSTLHILDKEIVINYEKLVNSLFNYKITICYLPTVIAEKIISEKNINPPHLRAILTGGDKLKHFPTPETLFKVFNNYGPTENTVVTTACEVYPFNLNIYKHETPPIGKPISNVSCYVLDNNFQPVPIEVEGELFISGIGLAKMYINNPQLTKKNFIKISLPYVGKIKLYRTGDIVKWLPNGNLQYIKRTDGQIKIRGYRIELSEIEKLLIKHESISDCALSICSQGDNKALIANLVPTDNNNEINSSSIYRFLKENLPDYMLPVGYRVLDKLPLNNSGKVDIHKLSSEKEYNKFAENEYVSAKTAIEKDLKRLWSLLLNEKKIGITDNFFRLGGHSLLVARIAIHIKNVYKIDVPLRYFYENPTIERLSQLIEESFIRKILNVSFATSNALDAIDFSSESTLPLELQPIPSSKNSTSIVENVLLTGASGFLGSHLLSDIFLKTNAKIYCIIRSSSIYQAYKKLEMSIERYGLSNLILSSNRVIPILGDLSKPRLGLSKKNFQEICKAVDIIYHCGAHVHHIFNYDLLKPTNVTSIVEILKLAATYKNKSIQFVSTLSAAIEYDGHGMLLEEFPTKIPEAHQLLGGYIQTKWVAEKLLTEAKQRGFRINIFRPGWIIGQSKTGAWAYEKEHHLSLVKGCLQLGYAPNWKKVLDMMPVDFISKLIVEVSLSSSSCCVYNLSNTKLIQWKTLFNWLKEYGYPVKMVDPKTWYEKYLPMLNKENAIFPLLGLYLESPDFINQQKHLVTIANSCTLHALKTLGMNIPHIGKEEFYIAFNYLQSIGFIN